MDNVGADQITLFERAVEVEIGGEASGACRTRAGAVDTCFTGGQRFVAKFEVNVGFAFFCTFVQTTRHRHTRQIVGQQQGPV